MRNAGMLEEASHAPAARHARKTEAKDSKIFAGPTTFAERKAVREAERDASGMPGQRLVSLGPTEFKQRNQRTNVIEYVPAELFVDVDHPMLRYLSIGGVPGLHALHAGDKRGDEVTPMGAMSRNHGPSGRTPAALPDPPPRPV